MTIKVPVGTRVIDQGTGETMGDMTKHGQRLLVAKGGWHGLGNTRFKSSVNRTPRQKTNGTPGDKRDLLLELMLLAGLPRWCRAWAWYVWTAKRVLWWPTFRG